MGTLEMLRHQEKACWDTFRLTGTTADLRTWHKALQRLDNELQQRIHLLRQGRVQTSARSYGL